MYDKRKLDYETVVQIEGVTRRFGLTTALDDVSLSVPRGTVFGLVGVNGAGKTTLIKHVLGLLKARTGREHVFGLDPVADPVGVLSKIGYLSEERDLPDWMRIDELLRYSRAFYSNWDDQYAEELRQTFNLDPARKIKQLSKGQRARTGLRHTAIPTADDCRSIHLEEGRPRVDCGLQGQTRRTSGGSRRSRRTDCRAEGPALDEIFVAHVGEKCPVFAEE